MSNDNEALARLRSIVTKDQGFTDSINRKFNKPARVPMNIKLNKDDDLKLIAERICEELDLEKKSLMIQSGLIIFVRSKGKPKTNQRRPLYVHGIRTIFQSLIKMLIDTDISPVYIIERTADFLDLKRTDQYVEVTKALLQVDEGHSLNGNKLRFDTFEQFKEIEEKVQNITN